MDDNSKCQATGMLYTRLLQRGRLVLDRHPAATRPISMVNFFSEGGCWMADMMACIRGEPMGTLVAAPLFNRYGFLKYAFAGLGLIGGGLILYGINPWLSPLAVFVFYWAEVQLLFLFPLLIDGAQRPIRRSIRLTRQIGTFYAMAQVMPIAFFMLLGLFDRCHPLRRWYIGCTAILIWYEDLRRSLTA